MHNLYQRHGTCLTSLGKFLTKWPHERPNEAHNDMRHFCLAGHGGSITDIALHPTRGIMATSSGDSPPSCRGRQSKETAPEHST